MEPRRRKRRDDHGDGNRTQAKPDYLGLLNAIRLVESRAGVYLRAWADVTRDPYDGASVGLRRSAMPATLPASRASTGV